MKYLKPYNESIKHLLKPKNKEDVINKINMLEDHKKWANIIKYDLKKFFSLEELEKYKDDYSIYIDKSLNMIYDRLYSNGTFDSYDEVKNVVNDYYDSIIHTLMFSDKNYIIYRITQQIKTLR